MYRIESDMTDADLAAWLKRHGHTYDSAAEELGIARRQLGNYVNGRVAIPLSLAKLCWTLDQLARKERHHA
jgi:transcriptional regulator with XRE-family HTH domain